MLPPEDVQLKRDVQQILKWTVDDVRAHPTEMKKHYANMSGALEFLSDNKESIRYKLIKKAKLHVESLLKSRL
jgi:hypothetical protein